MRILHVIDHWGLGGAQRALAALVRHETMHQHQVVAVFGHDRREWELPQHVPLTILTGSYSGLPKAVLGLRTLLRRQRPDVVQVHLNGARFLTAMALWGMRAKPTLVWHEHSGQELLKKYGRPAGRALLQWQRFLVKRVARVVGNSNSTLTYLDDYLQVGPQKTALIHCPVDSSHILARSKDEVAPMPPGTRNDGPVVGFIGRLADQKGPEDLIAVARTLKQKRPTAQLWVIGDGPLRQPLERRVHAEGLGDHVLFWGQRCDVYAVMARMSLVLMPSRYEPFGLVAVEAFVLGKPVVGYSVGGLADVLGLSHLGIAVPRGDVGALIDAVQSLLEAPPVNHDDSQVQHPFEPERICEEWQKLYADLVTQSKDG